MLAVGKDEGLDWAIGRRELGYTGSARLLAYHIL